jgi:uncharacterized membrane protein YfcA
MESSYLVYIILFFSSFFRSTFGFGDALVAMPLLTLVIGLRSATPLVALIASTIALTILVRNWTRVDIQSAWRLIVSSLVGIPVGLFLLKGAYEGFLKSLLAMLLITFGLYSLFKPRLIYFQTEKPAFVFGFFAGILGGAYNTNGPLAVIYGTLKRWDPESFRATLQGYFLPTSLAILLGHGLGGLWNEQIIRTYLYALPLVFLAVFLGGRINRVLSPQRFVRYIYFLLIALGLLLLWQTLA